MKQSNYYTIILFKRYTLFVCGWIVLTFTFSLLADLYVIYVAWISSDKRFSFRNTKEKFFQPSKRSFGVPSFSHRSLPSNRLFLCIAALYQRSSPTASVENNGLTCYTQMCEKVCQIWGLGQEYFPLINGFESYFNPWLYLVLNGQLRREVTRAVGFSSRNSAQESTTAS